MNIVLKMKNLELKDISKKEIYNYLREKKSFEMDMKKIPDSCKNIDEIYIHEKTKNIFIIQKVFKKLNESNYIKLQSGNFKKNFFVDNIPNYKIYYIFVISNELIELCRYEINYLKNNDINIFFSDKTNYKNIIFDYIKKEI